MDFIKFFFSDTGNKIYCYFLLLFTLIFFVVGNVVRSINMKWHDIFPMYIVFAAIMLTLVIYSLSKYRYQKKDSSNDNDDYLVIRDNDKKK